jgi:hypothetical protein
MKTKFIYVVSLAIGLTFFTSCEDQLTVDQQGATSVESFYQTDEDANQAIAAVYFQWRSFANIDFLMKNNLSDDIYSGGGSRGDFTETEQINEYTFSISNFVLSDYFSGLYTLIYRANLVINNFADDSSIKKRSIAEAKVARAWAYFNLVTLWGPVPLVTKPLSPSEYQQPNGAITEIWTLIEKDLNEAVSVGILPEKASATDKSIGARITKQYAMALLGKSQLFEGKNAEAATTLKAVVSSGKYALIADYGNVLRSVEDFGSENLFEVNSINDGDNADNQGTNSLSNIIGWRSDKMSLLGYFMKAHDLYPGGWGFSNPTKDLYDAFVEMEGANGYRLNNTLKTYEQVKMIGAPVAPITINAGTSLYGHEGYFNWKWRLLGSELITNSSGYATDNNYRFMRYAEVLLLASEACLQSGDQVDALNYINQIRSRAQLPALSVVTLNDIKKEKRLELCLEMVRFQDLVRWGDAATVLANRGKQIPVFDGTAVTFPYTNQTYGFKKGKHELLPFPDHEIVVNKNLKQNPGW